MRTLIQNETYYLEVTLTDNQGDFVTGSGNLVTYEIRRSSDDVLIDSGTMNPAGDIYKAQISLSALGQYRAIYYTPNKYENGSEILQVVEEITDDLSGIIARLNRILGLCQENYRVIDPVHDNKNNLVSAILKLYGSASDTDNDLNPIAEYNVTATHDGKGRMTGYKVTKQ